jgi:NADPH-dependent 2,4-dienoyl-CoA reductase/sulfur reductase-like enzyme
MANATQDEVGLGGPLTNRGGAEQRTHGDPWRTAGTPHVVIVGGGFAGLYAARVLRRAPVQVTVVDRRNHHLS